MSVMTVPPPRRTLSLVAATVVAGATMLALDLTWLGVVAVDFYRRSLGGLQRAEPLLPAAGMFYAMYLTGVMIAAVSSSHSRADAVRRGAAVGLFGYASFELTCWAVLRDWPAILVPVDIAWGICMTAAVAWIGKVVLDRME